MQQVSFSAFQQILNEVFSERCHFTVTVFLLEKKKLIQLFSIFLFYRIKISVFDKSY